MKNLVLVLNCGSSSIKFALINPQDGFKLCAGLVEKIFSTDTFFSVKFADEKIELDLGNADYESALQAILNYLQSLPADIQTSIAAVGHRVVHGGEYFRDAVLVDADKLEKIRECINLAPLHNPANVLGIEWASKHFLVPQVAVFDTAFHQTMPKHAYLYALPYELYQDKKIRRYGFHGTSHCFVAQQCAKLLGQPLNELALLSAHLGNGCSATAILNGQSIDTSMGLTPLEGLVMGSRCGDIDPSIPLLLERDFALDNREVDEILNKKSGLLGISGVSMDMRSISILAEEGNERAQLAIEIFCYRLAKYLAALSVPLQRIDALIFTGGIGENSALIRKKVLEYLQIFGFKLSANLNLEHGKSNKGIITQENTRPLALVIPTNEELMIAQDVVRVLGGF